MPKKIYSEEYRRDAVTMYETTPGASMNSIARDLGINRNTLKGWITKYSSDRRAGSTDTSEAAAVTDAERIRQLERDNIRLREERDILRRAAKYFAEETCLVSRFQFVEDARTDYPVKRLCTVLNLNRSSYYKWRTSRPSRHSRLLADAALAARITAVFDEHHRCYGAKRIAAELNDASGAQASGDGVDTGGATVVNHKRVARLMKTNGLVGYTRRRKVKTTVADEHRRVFADLVKRRFCAGAVNEVYVGDITYLPIADGANMYLSTVIDCWTRPPCGGHADPAGERGGKGLFSIQPR